MLSHEPNIATPNVSTAPRLKSLTERESRVASMSRTVAVVMRSSTARRQHMAIMPSISGSFVNISLTLGRSMPQTFHRGALSPPSFLSPPI